MGTRVEVADLGLYEKLGFRRREKTRSAIHNLRQTHQPKSEIKLPLKYAIQILFFLVLLALGLSIYRDYGISWDDSHQRLSGAVTLKYIVERVAPSLLKGRANTLPPLNEFKDRDYGIAFEAPAVALEKMLGITDTKEVFTLSALAYVSSRTCGDICRSKNGGAALLGLADRAACGNVSGSYAPPLCRFVL
jgi:hypothetical protein